MRTPQKTIALLRFACDRPLSESVAWLRMRLCNAYVPVLPQGARVELHSATLPDPWTGQLRAAAKSEAPKAAGYDAIVDTWSDADPEGTVITLQNALDEPSLTLHVYAVAERVCKPGRSEPQPEDADLIAAWTGAPGVAPAELDRHWREHIPLALEIHHGSIRYVQNRVERPLTRDAPPFAGIALLRFPALSAIATGLFRSAADVQTITDDVAEFIASTQVMYAAPEGLTASDIRQSALAGTA